MITDRAVADSVAYCAAAASICASSAARTAGSPTAAAACRAEANARAAASSICFCAAVRSVPRNPPPPPLAAASAAWASPSCCWAAGELMTAITWPAVTLWPGVTSKAPRVPAEGAVSVAAARAVTVADASTTSVTLPRSAVPRPTGCELPEHAEAPSISRVATAVNATRGARRTPPIVARAR